MGSEHLSSTAKGVFRHRYIGSEFSPPICLLKFPVKQGESWEAETRSGEQKMKVTCRVGTEEVEWPAGKYLTSTVQVDVEAGDMKTRSTYWLAAGVGAVKQFHDVGGKTITLELERFEAGN